MLTHVPARKTSQTRGLSGLWETTDSVPARQRATQFFGTSNLHTVPRYSWPTLEDQEPRRLSNKESNQRLLRPLVQIGTWQLVHRYKFLLVPKPLLTP